MKNLIAIAIFIVLSITTSEKACAQTDASPKISTISSDTLIITGVQLHFIKFHEYYSEAYKEIYQNGVLVDIMYGNRVYVYKTYTYKSYPRYK